MHFAAAFVQHYFLEVDPRFYEEVAASLVQDSAPRVGPWRLFAWLDRPSIWAVRAIQRTSGLDTFLFDDHGLPGVTDVAEMISFPFSDGPAGQMESPGIMTTWTEFEPVVKGDGVLCATFLWPDWDALATPGLWSQAEGDTPAKSRVLEAVRAVFRASLETVFSSKEGQIPSPPPLLLAASAGDADLILYGWMASAEVLDRCLFLLTRMCVSDLCLEIYGTPSPNPGAACSVFRASQTELAVDLHVYMEAVRRAGATDEARQPETFPTQPSFPGDFSAEIGLSRGHGSLAHLGNGIRDTIGSTPQWCERTIFGGEDMILASTGTVTFPQIIELQARLDAALARDARFVRRSSLRIGISNSYGRSKPPMTNPGRTMVPVAAEGIGGHSKAVIPEDMGAVRVEIERLTQMKWREDVRIIERMVERCVTLQKAFNIRLETRQMAKIALGNIVRHCATIRNHEEEVLRLKRGESSEEDGEMTVDYRSHVIAQFEEDIRMARQELLKAGMFLDRALAHHSKGVIPLLLHPASEARGPEHFGSEIGLSVGLGAMFQSAAVRLWREIQSTAADHPEWEKSHAQLQEALRNIQHPTVFASHEPDFGIQPRLGFLRVPRWALWYAPASSHLMHEFGHAVALIGALQYLVTATINGFAGRWDEVAEELHDSVRHVISHSGGGALNLRHHVEYSYHYGLLQDQYRLIEETASDIVSRLYSYPPDEKWDAVWLEHCLKYIVPFVGRENPFSIKCRLKRLQGAYVAVRLMRRARQHNPQAKDLAIEELEAVHAHASVETEHFISSLMTWRRKAEQDASTREFPSWVIDSLTEICSDHDVYRHHREMCRYFPTSTDLYLPEFVHVGWLLCCAMCLPLGKDMKEVSAIKGMLVWRALLRAGWQHEDETHLVGALAKCEVPSQPCRFPERLPSLLVWTLHEERGLKVEPATRIALSFYLRDLYKFKKL